MNTLAYSSQQPEKVAPKVEDLLRRELGATTPVPYEVETADANKTTVGTVLKEAIGKFFGSSEVPLFTLTFNVNAPRTAKVEVRMNRQGIGCHAGTLLYSARLNKKVAGEVTLDDPKTFSNSPFSGDPAACERLNANKALLKKANAFAVTKGQAGGMEITIPRFCRIAPDGDGAILVAATLGQPHMLGFKISMRSKDFFELAEMIEAAL